MDHWIGAGFLAGLLPGNSQGRTFWGGRIIRPQLRPDYPALESLQRLDFERGYLYPPSSSFQPAQSLHKNLPSFTTIRATSRTQDLQDLLLHPTKALDLWRFEGEDPDLHPHRSDLHFPLICLRALLLVFLFGISSCLLLMYSC